MGGLCIDHLVEGLAGGEGERHAAALQLRLFQLDLSGACQTKSDAGNDLPGHFNINGITGGTVDCLYAERAAGDVFRGGQRQLRFAREPDQDGLLVVFRSCDGNGALDAQLAFLLDVDGAAVGGIGLVRILPYGGYGAFAFQRQRAALDDGENGQRVGTGRFRIVMIVCIDDLTAQQDRHLGAYLNGGVKGDRSVREGKVDYIAVFRSRDGLAKSRLIVGGHVQSAVDRDRVGRARCQDQRGRWEQRGDQQGQTPAQTGSHKGFHKGVLLKETRRGGAVFVVHAYRRCWIGKSFLSLRKFFLPNITVVRWIRQEKGTRQFFGL